MREQRIWQKVMEKYPKLDIESRCEIERRARDMARNCYYKKLLANEATENISDNSRNTQL